MINLTHFPGAKKYWYMGELHDWDSREIHVMSHVLHYGSSVFEGIRAYDTEKGPAVFRLPEHIDRFFLSGETLNMKIPYTKEEITEAILLVIRENKVRSAYIRPLLFYGYGNLGLVPRACPVELIIGCWYWGAYLGDEAVHRGVHAMLLPWRRLHPSQINMSAKLGGMYVQSTLAGSHARKLGYDEGLFLNLEGRIAEGPGENLFIIKNKEIKTNASEESILEGITRTSILKIAEDLGYKVHIGPISIEEFLKADEAFFTGTAAEVTPLTRFTDGSNTEKPKEQWFSTNIGNGKPGPVTLELARTYKDTVHGKRPEYDSWLTYAYESPLAAQEALKDVAEERY